MEKEYSVDEKNLPSATKLESVGGKLITSVGNTLNFSVWHLLAAWWSEHVECDTAHQSILALVFDGPHGLTGMMQSEIPSGTWSVLSGACCSSSYL